MTHNDEKDRYRNNGLIASFSDKFSENLELKFNTRISETYLQYDAVWYQIYLAVHLLESTLYGGNRCFRSVCKCEFNL